MKKKFNIAQLYQQVFGITGVRYDIPSQLGNAAKITLKATEFEAVQYLNESKNNGLKQTDLYSGVETIPLPSGQHIKSVLGTPIYEQITLNVPIYDLLGKKTSPAPLSYTFPDWPLFDINPKWIIKTTNIPQLDGSIKEFICQDDFDITIRGFLINHESQDYPENLLSDLWAVINSKKSIGIASRVFNLLDIHNIVIKDARFPAVEGYMNVQPFELDCVSDMPLILQIRPVKTGKPI